MGDDNPLMVFGVGAANAPVVLVLVAALGLIASIWGVPVCLDRKQVYVTL